MDVVVRQAKENDFQNIVESSGGTESNPFNQFSSVDRLRKLPPDGLIVAEVDNVFAGFLYWVVLDEQKKGVSVKTVHIVVVKVEKRYRKKQVGISLLTKALKDIEKLGVNSINVDVSEADTKLRDLYERVGFSAVDRTLRMRHIYAKRGNPADRTEKEKQELDVFVVELSEQCRTFMTAYSEILEMVSNVPSMEEEGKRVLNRRIWSRLQACLTSCSIISNILWKSIR